jgi:hypothetical protein
LLQTNLIIHICFTEDIPSSVLQVNTRSTTKKLRHCFENHRGRHLRSRVKIVNEGECIWMENIREMIVRLLEDDDY